jgi:hypothetical protein
MEPNFKTSFIPKKPMVEERAAPARSIGIFTIISFFILFAVLLATGGLFFYKGVLAKNIKDMQVQLNVAKNRFEPSKITELKMLDKRLRASTEILSKHIAISPVFEALSAITMKNVRYTNFSYTLGAEKDAKVKIQLKGVAVGYRSVALQSELFATKDEGKNFIEPVFSGLALDDKGNVIFNLEFSVDPSFVDYRQMILKQS